MTTPALVLASSSPRRRDLLATIGVVPARVVSPDIDETPAPGELPRAYTLRMAREKAAAVPCGAGEAVLAGDTCVALGRRILGQAGDRDAIVGYLRQLSGRRHRVWSAVTVRGADGIERSRLSESIVRFKPLSDAEITAYAESGEGIGKAGGYAIQGRAAGLVAWHSGSHSGIVGLPLFETRALLLTAGFALG